MIFSKRELKALYEGAFHEPLLGASILLLGWISAILEGIGLSFILPIVEVARSPTPLAEQTGPVTIFVEGYSLLGVEPTLETLIVGVAVVMAVRYTATFGSTYLASILRNDYDRHLRIEVYERALSARVSYFDEKGTDDILNTLVTQTAAASRLIQTTFGIIQMTLVTLVYVLLSFYLAPTLTIATGIILGGVAFLSRYFIESGSDIGERVVRANQDIQETAQRVTYGIRDIKLFGMVEASLGQFSDAVDRRTETKVVQERNRAILDNAYRFLSALVVFVLIYATLRFTDLSLGALTVFLFAMLRLAPRVSNLNSEIYGMENTLPHLIETQEFIDELERNQEPDQGTRRAPSPITEIEFDDVTFSYGSGETALQNISFSATRSAFVAFVGKSGAGKSTIVSLVSQMYYPDDGQIRANGVPIDDIDLRDWRSRIAVVRQNPYVFNETLRFNLTVGNPEASLDRIEEVCEIAQVTEFFDDLPAGYDTQLGEDGVRLSGGQRQRVALARALLKDADILILDEATSDLDTGIEQDVQAAIEAMERDYIMFVIAHRLSTVTNADRIYTIQDGGISEIGTHEVLMERDGTYAKFYTRQLHES